MNKKHILFHEDELSDVTMYWTAGWRSASL